MKRIRGEGGRSLGDAVFLAVHPPFFPALGWKTLEWSRGRRLRHKMRSKDPHASLHGVELRLFRACRHDLWNRRWDWMGRTGWSMEVPGSAEALLEFFSPSPGPHQTNLVGVFLAMNSLIRSSASILARPVSRSAVFAAVLLSVGSFSGCGGSSETETPTAEVQSKPGQDSDERRLVQATPTVSAPVGDEPPISIEPPILDFGFIAPDTPVRGSVKLINRGDKDLLILAAEPSCKCTTLDEIGGTVIPAGGSVDLGAELDATPNIGTKSASIKILIDGYPVVKVLDLKAEIALPIRPIPTLINAVQGQSRQGRIVVESIDSEPFSICSFHGMPPEFLGFNPGTDSPRNKYILTYDLDRMVEPYPRYLVIETDREDVPVVDVYLRHESTLPKLNRNLQVSGGYRFPLGRLAPGESTELEIPFKSVARSIATVISARSEIAADLVGTRTEETSDGIMTYALVRITPSENFRGVLYAPIEIVTAGGDSAVINVFGIVVPEGEDCAGPMLPGTEG